MAVLAAPLLAADAGPGRPRSSGRSSDRLAAGLTPGARVEIKGKFLPDGVFLADEIELKREPDRDEELRGLIEWVDPERRRLKVLGFVVQVAEDTELSLEPARPARFEDLEAGVRVKVDGRRDTAGIFVARKVRIRQKQYPERKIVGEVESIEATPLGYAQFQVLGLRVLVNEATDLIEQGSRARRALVQRRIGVVDDEDLQFLGRHRLWSRLALSGEFRMRATIFSNPDLDGSTRDSQTVPELFGIVGMAADLGPAFAYAEVIGEREFFIRGGEGFRDEEDRADVRVGEAYVHFGLDPSSRLSLAIGRQKFNEERRWYYDNKNLDAARVFLDFYPFSFEASVSRDLFDESSHLRDQSRVNGMLHAAYEVRRDLSVEAYYIRRKDQTDLHDSPRIAGLRGIGDLGKHFRFWIDLAFESGTRGRIDAQTGGVVVRDVRARALDAAIIFRPRILLNPSFILGYAYGSGDDELELPAGQVATGADGTFRQSGLQRNRDSFNGVVSFRYYGEVLDPELSNLRILTLGQGFRPLRPLSLDVVFHHYRQDARARRLDGVEIDARPSGIDPDLGDEVDLIVGYEPRKDLELRLTAGRFFPGSAFPDGLEAATVVAFQSKFRF